MQLTRLGRSQAGSLAFLSQANKAIRCQLKQHDVEKIVSSRHGLPDSRRDEQFVRESGVV